MDGRKNGDRLLGDIDATEDSSSLRDTGQTLVEDIWREMAELEVDVVLFGSNTAALADFDGNASRYDVAGCKILCRRCVALHETLTLRVDQVASFTA